MDDLDFIEFHLDVIKAKTNPTSQDFRDFDLLLKAKRLIEGQPTEILASEYTSEEIEDAQKKLRKIIVQEMPEPIEGLTTTRTSDLLERLKQRKINLK